MLQAIIAGVVALFIAGGSVWATHSIDQAAYEKLEISYQKNYDAAVDKAVKVRADQDAQVLDDAVKQAESQRVIETKIQTVIKEVPKYVNIKVPVACVSYGLVGVFDAIALGVDESDLALPPGKSYDSCTGLTTADLASHIGRNYGNTVADDKQLTDLQNSITGIIDKANGKTGEKP